MRQTFKDIEISLLEEIVTESDSLSEVTIKLGYNLNSKKNIERLIKRNNISIEHFSTIKRARETSVRYEKNKLIKLTQKAKTFKEILFELDLLPVQRNYGTLKKYLNKYEINYSHIKGRSPDSLISIANYSESNLKKLVLESSTISELIFKLGIVPRGSNFKTVKKYIQKYNIDISHFNPNSVRINKLTQFNKIPTNEILVENSTYVSSNSLKIRLYDEKIKIPICELCGQNENWRGQHMSLILDHINGNHSDNRIENLRIVCPNCNATLLTHCGKNVNQIKKHNHCECGKIITKKAKLCNSCAMHKRFNNTQPPYRQLLDEINELGYCATGRKYGVSDNAIRKWIKRYETN